MGIALLSMMVTVISTAVPLINVLMKNGSNDETPSDARTSFGPPINTSQSPSTSPFLRQPIDIKTAATLHPSESTSTIAIPMSILPQPRQSMPSATNIVSHKGKKEGDNVPTVATTTATSILYCYYSHEGDNESAKQCRNINKQSHSIIAT